MSADPSVKPEPRPAPAEPSQRLWGAGLGVLVALPACTWLWGFTVDDALITARVAAHIARGLGPRFNPGGPAVDAVTPLGYAQLLSLFGHGDVLAVFRAAQWLGLGAWLAAAALLGVLVARAGERARRFTPLGIVLVSAPLAAWAVSGMETAIVTLLATLGLCGGWASALALGVAAAWRPELALFAFALVAARARVERRACRRAVTHCALVAVPILLTALTRESYFGRLVPLSFYAKPSDFAHGFQYALGAFAFSGLPWLLLGLPSELRAVSARARPLVLALGAHFMALILCGGDWMALYRLAVPVLPCAALAAAYLAETARSGPTVVRFSLALATSLILAWGLGAPARHVGAQRAALIAEARPALAHYARIASLDIGWVGAAARDAQVIDLAGVTDPEVAFFPGGHTSKRIPSAWLFARQPSAIVLLLRRGAALEPKIEDLELARAAEVRVAGLVASSFHVRRTLTLADQSYVVLEPDPGR